MTPTLSPSDAAKLAASIRAVEFIQDDMKVGLGTGSTAAFMVRRLAQRVRDEGLKIVGVPTSTRTAELAQAEGIALTTLDAAGTLDVTIDGADEFDRDFQLIKGGGGALLQEKIVAAASDRMIVIADAGKAVQTLGAFPLPVEVIPFGAESTIGLIGELLADLGYDDVKISKRMAGDALFQTDESNHIVDLHMGKIVDAGALAAKLNQIPGVVENGLFIDLAGHVVLGHADGRVELLAQGATPEETKIDFAIAGDLAHG